MDVLLIVILIVFLILTMALGIENTFKILPFVIILGVLIYFIGWAIVFFAPLIFVWLIFNILVGKNRGRNSTYSRTYKRTSDDDFFNSYRRTGSGSSRTTYGGTFNSQEEAEEFFRTFFGGGFGGSTNTGGSSYGGYSSQNGSGGYQRNTYGTYTTDKSKYYTILGVSKNASQDEIKKAYHKLAKEHHPDKFVNSSDSEKKYHENKMKEINDAYENLTK